ADNHLTIDAVGGFNTKINYIEIRNISFNTENHTTKTASIDLPKFDGNLPSFIIYPNPASAEVNIEVLHSTNLKKIVLCDLNGSVLESFNPNNIKMENRFIFPLYNFPLGVYILNLEYNGGEVISKKLIIKR
ncbi:MAG: T9SS type A sorting domain-containing protein, partial [Leeuwenhoekiella sp.]